MIVDYNMLIWAFMEKDPIWVGNSGCRVRLKSVKDIALFKAWCNRVIALSQ